MPKSGDRRKRSTRNLTWSRPHATTLVPKQKATTKMPVAVYPPAVFPALTMDSILEFQFSSWFSRFSQISIKSTIIRPLSEDFRDYLNSDGVFVPQGSEDV